MWKGPANRKHCPENFENRAALVAAEIARIEDRDRDAVGLYEQAIRTAHANGFVHNEAIAYELAARFYAARGFGARKTWRQGLKIELSPTVSSSAWCRTQAQEAPAVRFVSREGPRRAEFRAVSRQAR